MEEEPQVFIRGYEHLTPEEKHRARRADAIYESALEEVGVEMDSFQRPAGWVEFVEGEIDEIELWARVLEERKRFQ